MHGFANIAHSLAIWLAPIAPSYYDENDWFSNIDEVANSSKCEFTANSWLKNTSAHLKIYGRARWDGLNNAYPIEHLDGSTFLSKIGPKSYIHYLQLFFENQTTCLHDSKKYNRISRFRDQKALKLLWFFK